MKYPKLRELKEAIKALIKGPYTSKFPHKPHTPFERFRGRPKFNKEECTGCGACTQVCPSGALTMRDVGDKRVIEVRLDICIFCGQCQANCLTEKGIALSQEFDFAVLEKRQEVKEEIEKDLVLCQDCGEIIAPYEQIIWVAKKLGPLAFSNPSLMLLQLQNKKLSSAEKESKSEKEEFLRADRIKVLCPRCRRKAVIKS